MYSVVETIRAQYVSESVKWLSEYWVTYSFPGRWKLFMYFII